MKKTSKIGSISRALLFPIIIFIASTTALFTTSCSGTDFEIYCSIYGSITDYETGERLENVSVVLSPTNKTFRTENRGTFVFEDLKPGKHTITVQKSGYKPNRKTVTAIRAESIETYYWANAKTACNNLVLGGFSDWRLPPLDELSIIYQNKRYTGITNAKQYWSSTISYNGNYRTMNFDFGTTSNNSSYCYFCAVRTVK